MTSTFLSKRLDALEAAGRRAVEHIVIGDGGCCVYLLEQPADESDADFQGRVRNLWLQQGRDPAQMPKFNF